jgi:hypothetical protein
MLCNIVRVCMIIKALENACHLLIDVDNNSNPEIDQMYYDSCQKKINNLGKSSFVIDKITITKAINLVETSTVTKLVLAEYNINISDKLDYSVRQILNKALVTG